MIGKLGKFVGSRRYFHIVAVPLLETQVMELIHSASSIAGVTPDREFNVVRIASANNTIALLSYPDFFEEAFPRLAQSWKVDLDKELVTLRDYRDSFNPPVLHRKELLLDSEDPRRPTYERLTSELESLGLFEDPVRIGFKLQWEKLLLDRGFRVVDHQLVPIGNEESFDALPIYTNKPIEIARHLTALSRQNFSAPMQILKRFGYLDGSRTIFDYGCGKGDDIRSLLANGINANGWDPHYAPEAPIASAELVNLGFVINVIEDPIERREALQRAFALTQELLVVSTMVATEIPGKVTFFADGVLTSRSTFQKYFTQAELREYLTNTLYEEPISVAPGIFFVFKDKDSEQRFQIGRYRSRIRVPPIVRAERPPCASRRKTAEERTAERYEAHRALLDGLWVHCLDLGREPDPSELPNLGAIEQALGSLRKALTLCFSHNDATSLARARTQRSDDLKVFLALQQFQKRQPYKRLDERLQRDVRAFFGNYASAQEHGRQLLFQVAKPEILDAASEVAAEQGLGWFEPSQSLQLHSSLVQRLPVALRVYVGCAGVLYGDVNEADLIKIHIRSGKVSFLKFDDFFGSPLPQMIERTKINLRALDLQIFAYGSKYPSPPLYLKSRFINEELLNYSEQLAFDEALQALNLVDLSGYGPSAEKFSEVLKEARWKVEGFSLLRLSAASIIDDRCGKYFTYRQLIECGETQASTRLPNLPKNLETYTALHDLATNILDPIVDYFGGIELTYGFCSAELAKRVPRRNAPELDQHAALEKKRTGAPICPRLGAAVDFLVRDENMQEVAEWVVDNLPFDRLYFYGSDRPIHVSYGPEHTKEAFQMVLMPKGSKIPRRLDKKSSRS